ncbi:MAG: ABC1 kinase family protein [Dehalococcoidia bacterium]
MNHSQNSIPMTKLGRMIPLAFTVIWIWLGWRWLRIKRKLFGDKRMEKSTHEFHKNSALSVVRQAIRQQGLIIKTCQFLGSRADVLMDEYITVLSLVHDQVPPRSWQEMQPIVEGELGGEVEKFFMEFDRNAIAAASLAQVYKAKKHDGTIVAVKVQYPNIESVVKHDLENLRILVNIWAKFETVIDFRPIIDEMERNAPEEVDFIHEGKAAEVLTDLLNDRSDVVIPKIHWDLSTRRVLTMDYLDGIKISNVEAQRAKGIDTPQVAETLIDLFNTMILQKGMFHADPHPGNLFVIPNPNNDGTAKIGLVDFGLTKKIPEEFRDQLIVLTSAIMSEQAEAITGTMEEMGFRTRDRTQETYTALGEAFLGDVLRSGKPYADQEMIAEINQQLGKVLRSNPLIDVPGDVILIARVMGLLSGLARILDSETDLLEALIPYLDPDAETVAV